MRSVTLLLFVSILLVAGTKPVCGQETPTGTACPPFQSFDYGAALPADWFMQNNSAPGPGTTGWFVGYRAFGGQSGGYIAADFKNGDGTSTISNWLLTPPILLQDGLKLSFWTRTVDAPSFPDRLQVRMSTNGASTNVGTSAKDVGDFNALLLDINPTYSTTGYPNVWTQFTINLTGIPSQTLGRLAFRYFVEGGGPNGFNSDYIGIDTLEISGLCGPTPTPTPTPGPTATPFEGPFNILVPAFWDFGSAMVGSSSNVFVFNVRNFGPISNFSLVDTTNFSIVGSDCGLFVADCHVSVRFNPFSAGFKSTFLHVELLTPCPVCNPDAFLQGTGRPLSATPAPTPSPTVTPTVTPTPTATATATPTPPGIVLVSRLSDARAFAAINVGSDSPPPQIQTDFLPASLTNSAAVSAESGGASADCTSNSSIVVDNQIGTLRITGNGTATGYGILMGSYGSASAKLIVTSFTLTDRSYAYLLTGQLLAEQFKGLGESTGTAKLAAGDETIFEVVATHSPAVILSQSGVLQPGDYTLSVEISGAGVGDNSPHAGVSRGSADFNFALGPVGAPTPTPTPATLLGNISTRLRVETGDNALIGGFIVTGTLPKKVIVRAIGPSLPVSGALADPTLELRDSVGQLIRSNDNWRSDQEQEIIDTGISPSNDSESAVVATLPAKGSAYTAIVRGVNDGTGVGLVEIYDLDPTVDSKLANISTRGLVQTGNDVMIAGTIVLGEASQRVLIRAIGPSLPVDGKLADPTLELRDSNGSVLRSNDNWRSDQETEITATGIPPANDLESALVETLSANGAAYTAIVRGVNDATGVALVEVYALTN